VTLFFLTMSSRHADQSSVDEFDLPSEPDSDLEEAARHSDVSSSSFVHAATYVGESDLDDIHEGPDRDMSEEDEEETEVSVPLPTFATTSSLKRRFFCSPRIKRTNSSRR
jgi:hypothetical protein